MTTQFTNEITRLTKLLVDLKTLEAGTIDPQELKAIPFLDNWFHSSRKVPCLEGVVKGHPTLPNGDQIVTSEVYAHLIANDEHFVRTLSRWYRLGERKWKVR